MTKMKVQHICLLTIQFRFHKGIANKSIQDSELTRFSELMRFSLHKQISLIDHFSLSSQQSQML